ncbi:conserved hypothetical protein [Ricinus communis]|uniref:RNase H type-1 domain-containing protein n=1 Tax=Ricinus communis TaxID=3988 RepID=B9SC59_RICCO|nr:conserved hypothetical protein [Ricinus communis]
MASEDSYKSLTLQRPLRSVVMVQGLPPSLGRVKVNIDGSVKLINGLASAGGLIRNTEGSWLFGFTHKLGSCSPLGAEFWGVLDGLRLAWDKGTKAPIARHWSITCTHACREANVCADWSAELAHDSTLEVNILDCLPADLLQLLLGDALGVGRLRNAVI